MSVNEICCIYKILNQVFVYKTRMSFVKCLKIVLFSRFFTLQQRNKPLQYA